MQKLSIPVHLQPVHHRNFPRTSPQDHLVAHNGCEDNQQKILHKYGNRHVTRCKSGPQDLESTTIAATLCPKAGATTLTGYNFTVRFADKKVHCSQVSSSNKNRLDLESFYRSNIGKLFYLNPEYCKNEQQRLK